LSIKNNDTTSDKNIAQEVFAKDSELLEALTPSNYAQLKPWVAEPEILFPKPSLVPGSVPNAIAFLRKYAEK